MGVSARHVAAIAAALMIGGATTAPVAVAEEGASDPAAPAAVSQTLVNRTEWPVTFNFAFPTDGEPVWQTLTLQPCQEHHWTAEYDPERMVTITWPMWYDQRVDENGNIVMTGSGLPLSSDGYAAFFPYGEQVWIDLSGAAKPCGAE